ncbi:MAG: hypothetical protein PVJ39_02140 [Gammaproteobacteria bacterium]|jgi:hypothetical protein
MLAIPIIVIVAVFLLSLSWLAFIVVRQKRVILTIRQAVHDADEQVINEVYAAIGQMGDGRSKAYILGRTNMASSLPGNQIYLPQTDDGFPWADSVVHIDTANGVNMVVDSNTDQQNRLAGKVYTSIAVPMVDNETGHGLSLFSPYKWITANPQLLAVVAKISPRYPEQTLTYLVTIGREDYQYEPAHQVRLVDGVSWVQKPDVPVCDTCQERMRYILQVPGILLDGKAEPNAIYYLFGCKYHADNTRCVTQFQ